jgi:hypothetical protein
MRPFAVQGLPPLSTTIFGKSLILVWVVPRAGVDILERSISKVKSN